MFIDYLAVMLVNLVAGLALLALYIYLQPDAQSQPNWAPVFGMVGFTAAVTGLPMVLNWPLMGSYNIAFGDPALLFGIAFLGATWSLAKGQGLLMPSLYGLFAAVVAIVVGARIMNLGMTKEPAMAGIAFILAGVGGVLVPLQAYLRDNRAVRLLVVLVLVVAAVLWAVTAYPTYWSHLHAFAKWAPATMAAAASATK